MAWKVELSLVTALTGEMATLKGSTELCRLSRLKVDKGDLHSAVSV